MFLNFPYRNRYNAALFRFNRKIRTRLTAFEEKLVGLTGRRKNVVAAMEAFDKYESGLAKQLRVGLRDIPGVHVFGPADPSEQIGSNKAMKVITLIRKYAPYLYKVAIISINIILNMLLAFLTSREKAFEIT